jgi:cobalt/nickel transport system ATP-binding protein
MIRVESLTHAYAGKECLRDISFEISAGEKIILLGSNGSGKSTLLKILDGLVKPKHGSYHYDGHVVTPASLRAGPLRGRFRGEVALLLQNPDVMLFNPTVRDEITFGPRQLGMDHIEERARHWAAMVGVEAYLDRPPFTLSGGEKQKLALAALFSAEPRLLLLDEPTAALDPRTTGWLVDFLGELPITTVCSTHNLSLAPELGQRALVLDEAHSLAHDGDIAPFLGDIEALIRANLVHSHRHRHGGVEHRHYHSHDWQ